MARQPTYKVRSGYRVPKFVGNWWCIGIEQWVDLRRVSIIGDVGSAIVIKYESSDRLRKIEGVTDSYFAQVVERWRKIREIDVSTK